ncbi:GNAT family N-acetyltransferase [Kitasatospora sp. NPDC093558]|uniref:GNAT family N-acetyltransferase n=1 Tax=Kitasatospora sp. NPDC093558 TaxID=3155201 RepID=UPI00342045F7
MALEFIPARLDDVDALLTLYRQVYGRSYALPLGTDPEVMAREITAPDTTWLVAREPGGDRLLGSILGTVDPAARIGKLQGLVIHPDARGLGAANLAVQQLANQLLTGDHPVDSVYATARTDTTAPQRICLKSGFRALGVLPNLRKAAWHETMVLLAKHRAGVLEQRLPVHKVPSALDGLVRALADLPGPAQRPELVDEPLPRPRKGASAVRELEFIDAPAFVSRRFGGLGECFYPFHEPNVMLSAADGAYEVYAHLSPADGYCTLIGIELAEIGEELDTITDRLAAHGARYIEALVPLDSYHSLRRLLGHGFLPVAAYPAMRREAEGLRDYVVLARILQPLDFRGLAIDAAFQPFTEQYIELWKQQHLDTHGIFQ